MLSGQTPARVWNTRRTEKARAEGSNSGSKLAMLPVLMWRSIKKPIVMGPLLGVILSATVSACSPLMQKRCCC
ncbi:hypothetical protein D3C75_477570 [compost metagenome]